MLRKSALTVLTLFILLAAATIWLLRSSWTEHLVENMLQDMFEAQVEIEGLSLDLLALQVSWQRLTIGDKDKEMVNLIETGPAALDVVGMPLFEKKLIVDLAKIEGVKVQSARSESGWLPKPPVAQSAPATPSSSSAPASTKVDETKATADLQQAKEEIPTLDLSALTDNINIDGLVDRDKLTSVAAVKNTRSELTQRYESWDKRLAQQTLAADARALKARMDKIDLNTKDLGKLKKQLEEIQSIQKEASRLQKEAAQLKKDFNQDIKDSKVQVKDMQGLVDKDVEQIRGLAKIADMDLNEVGKVLFGRAVIDQLEEVLGYLRQARDFVKAEESPAAAYQRREGRDIHFARTSPILPDFLLVDAQFSGEDGGDKYSGALRGVSSSAKTYGKPVELNMTLTSNRGFWQVKGEFDRTSKVSRDALWINGDQLTLGSIDLQTGKESGMPKALVPKSSKVDGTFSVTDGQLKGELTLTSSKVSFDFYPQNGDKTKADIKAMFDDFDSVDVKTRLGGSLTSPSISVNSNLDNKLSARFKALLGQKIKDAEKNIRKAVESEANKELESAKKAIADKGRELTKQLEDQVGGSADLDKQAGKLKSDLEKRIKSKGASELKDSLKNLRL